MKTKRKLTMPKAAHVNYQIIRALDVTIEKATHPVARAELRAFRAQLVFLNKEKSKVWRKRFRQRRWRRWGGYASSEKILKKVSKQLTQIDARLKKVERVTKAKVGKK